MKGCLYIYFVKMWSYQRLCKGCIKGDDIFFILCCWNLNFHFSVSMFYNHYNHYYSSIWLLVGALVQPFVVLCYVYIALYIFFLTIYLSWHSNNIFLIILSLVILIDHDDFTIAVMSEKLLQYIFYCLFRKIVYLLYALVSAIHIKR